MHTCKACSKIPHHLRSEEHKLLDEIFGILVQSRISKVDSERLATLAVSNIPEVSLHATLVFEISQIRPYKKGRNKFLEKRCPDLLKKLVEAGLVYQ